MTEPLIVARPNGLYCAPGDFYIDPRGAVDRAVITHGHSDHARFGARRYLCHNDTAPIMAKRLGDVSTQGLRYGEVVSIAGVTVSLHPAGHILGSAQVRVEHRGEVVVVSGDYKTQPDATCMNFEPVRCDRFITESTFALPIYRWLPAQDLYAQVNAWWADNAANGRASIIQAYALGKAQRILAHLDPSIGPIVCHGAVESMNDIYRARGVSLPSCYSTHDSVDYRRALAIGPPSAAGGAWARRFGESAAAFASGWMQVRGARRRSGVDQGFALSDHADWPGLLDAIAATGATRVVAMHGSSATLARYLREQGLDADTIETHYSHEDDGGAEAAPSPEDAP